MPNNVQNSQAKVLLIDDQREPEHIKKTTDSEGRTVCFTNEEVVVARTVADGMLQLTNSGPWDVLLLDHDMGTKKTGYDVLCFLEEHTQYLPKTVILVTANMSGGAKMFQCLERLKEKGFIDNFDWRR